MDWRLLLFLALLSCHFVPSVTGALHTLPLKKVHLRGAANGVLKFNGKHGSPTRAMNLLEAHQPMEGNEESSQWIIHLETPVRSEAVKEINARLHPTHALAHYLPESNFLLVAPEHVAAKLLDSPYVHGVSHFDQVR